MTLISTILIGCGVDQEKHEGAPVDVGDTIQSDCKPNSKSDALSSGTIKATVANEVVTVTHEDATYNCAARLKLTATVSGFEILVTETVMNPNEAADCICDFDLSVPVKGLADGTYQVKVESASGELVGTTQVTVGSPAPKVSVGQTFQSDCKPETDGPSSSGAIKATVNGNSVTITHEDATYNCAARLKLTAKVIGNQIVVTETILNPNELADCTCNFDLSVVVSELAAGTYQVKVLSSSGLTAGVTTVTVGSGAAAGPTLQSQCKGVSNGPGGANGATGKIKTTVVNGTLTITHEDAVYNCAARVMLVATVGGTSIVVRETITNPGVSANCICPFDLTAAISGLAPGTYSLKVYDADGNLVGSATVAV
jgi:hypothetical protein